MLYEELSNLCPDCTYEQYENIERIYNACPSMSKEKAAEVWRTTYGVEVECARQVTESTKAALCSGILHNDIISGIAHRIEDNAKSDIYNTKTEYNGVKIRRILVNNINYGSVLQYALEIFDGSSWMRTKYRYSMPDFYVWTV